MVEFTCQEVISSPKIHKSGPDLGFYPLNWVIFMVMTRQFLDKSERGDNHGRAKEG